MATITYLTTIHFDFGALRLLPGELQRLGVRRPLVVTDRGVAAAGLLDRVTGAIGDAAEPAVFDGTPPNPTEDAVMRAAQVYRERACDGLVAVGGGSSIDLAKAVALIVTHPEPLLQYAAVEGGVGRITPKVAPLVAIPTTAGTGSEVGRGSVIVMRNGRKLGLLSPHLLPKVALCDPELTLGLPPMLTAATGMDAIAHCIETFCAPAVNPPAEAIALDGLRRGSAHIERATRDGGDRQARWEMMMAAMEGAMAFQKGLGAVHALSHPLGALPGRALHHGTLNAVLLPAVLRFNAPVLEAKARTLTDAMGLAPGADPAAFIEGLNARLGLPAGLAAMGVERAELPAIADAALLDHCHATNPRPATREDYIAMLEAAFGG
ncbi:iron-containing alcohol dehydrogenase [Burkholderiaceae bacterium FT117]|uniref:iron-containing alcohol dehydrogenase n=1 Tax=Zeimonas sediminis TaxID=2944268 RepID=UPI002342CDA0|nr:iron-containing alcohol dehydrogenase [Zeimonas sediminis]MCM5570404.1 iron-containing alcohol dehydrogenase [Zeimonas sediminis]